MYQSRCGDALENWAFFEPAAPTEQGHGPFDDDPDLTAALELHLRRLGG